MSNVKVRTANLPVIDEFGGRFPNAVVTISVINGVSEIGLKSDDGIKDYASNHEIGKIRFQAMYKYDPSQVNMTLRQLKEMRHVTRYYDAEGSEVDESVANDLKIEAAKNGDNAAAYVTESTSLEAVKDLFVDLDDPSVVAAMQGQANSEEVMFRAVFADLQRRAKQ